MPIDHEGRSRQWHPAKQETGTNRRHDKAEQEINQGFTRNNFEGTRAKVSYVGISGWFCQGVKIGLADYISVYHKALAVIALKIFRV